MLEELTKIVIAFALVFTIGIERTLQRKSIGFGSFTLVAIGSTTLAITGTLVAPGEYLFLLNGIITSIGFLGAGALFRTREGSFGFTTASTLWTTAILGLTIGLNLYPLALTIYLLIWCVIGVDWFIEKEGLGNHAQTLSVTFRGIRDTEFLTRRFTGLTYQIQSVRYYPKDSKTLFTLRIQDKKKNVLGFVKDLAIDLDIKELVYN